MFVLRLVTLDHYMVAPSAPLDPLVSKLGGWEVWQVPVIRIFGITPAGQKACLHVHGAMPYLTVPCTESRPERFAVVLASEIDLLLNTAAGRATSMHRHVHHVGVIRATPLYGFHDREQTFLRIYLYNPMHVAKVSELLLSGLVLKRVMQPHEAHIPFALQFMVDHNLHGMGLVRVDPFKFRRPSCWKPSSGEGGAPHSGSTGTWDLHSLPPELFGDLEKQAVCELELDCCARDILNAQETEAALNPGLAALWQEEEERRQEPLMWTPLSVEDEDFPSPESEQFYLARLDKLLAKPDRSEQTGAKPKKSHHHILDTSHGSLDSQDEALAEALAQAASSWGRDGEEDSILGSQPPPPEEEEEEEEEDMSQVFQLAGGPEEEGDASSLSDQSDGNEAYDPFQLDGTDDGPPPAAREGWRHQGTQTGVRPPVLVRRLLGRARERRRTRLSLQRPAPQGSSSSTPLSTGESSGASTPYGAGSSASLAVGGSTSLSTASSTPLATGGSTPHSMGDYTSVTTGGCASLSTGGSTPRSVGGSTPRSVGSSTPHGAGGSTMPSTVHIEGDSMHDLSPAPEDWQRWQSHHVATQLRGPPAPAVSTAEVRDPRLLEAVQPPCWVELVRLSSAEIDRWCRPGRPPQPRRPSSRTKKKGQPPRGRRKRGRSTESSAASSPAARSRASSTRQDASGDDVPALPVADRASRAQKKPRTQQDAGGGQVEADSKKRKRRAARSKLNSSPSTSVETTEGSSHSPRPLAVSPQGSEEPGAGSSGRPSIICRIRIQGRNRVVVLPPRTRQDGAGAEGPGGPGSEHLQGNVDLGAGTDTSNAPVATLSGLESVGPRARLSACSDENTSTSGPTTGLARLSSEAESSAESSLFEVPTPAVLSTSGPTFPAAKPRAKRGSSKGQSSSLSGSPLDATDTSVLVSEFVRLELADSPTVDSSTGDVNTPEPPREVVSQIDGPSNEPPPCGDLRADQSSSSAQPATPFEGPNTSSESQRSGTNATQESLVSAPPLASSENATEQSCPSPLGSANSSPSVTKRPRRKAASSKRSLSRSPADATDFDASRSAGNLDSCNAPGVTTRGTLSRENTPAPSTKLEKNCPGVSLGLATLPAGEDGITSSPLRRSNSISAALGGAGSPEVPGARDPTRLSKRTPSRLRGGRDIPKESGSPEVPARRSKRRATFSGTPPIANIEAPDIEDLLTLPCTSRGFDLYSPPSSDLVPDATKSGMSLDSPDGTVGKLSTKGSVKKQGKPKSSSVPSKSGKTITGTKASSSHPVPKCSLPEETGSCAEGSNIPAGTGDADTPGVASGPSVSTEVTDSPEAAKTGFSETKQPVSRSGDAADDFQEVSNRSATSTLDERPAQSVSASSGRLTRRNQARAAKSNAMPSASEGDAGDRGSSAGNARRLTLRRRCQAAVPQTVPDSGSSQGSTTAQLGEEPNVKGGATVEVQPAESDTQHCKSEDATISSGPLRNSPLGASKEGALQGSSHFDILAAALADMNDDNQKKNADDLVTTPIVPDAVDSSWLLDSTPDINKASTPSFSEQCSQPVVPSSSASWSSSPVGTGLSQLDTRDNQPEASSPVSGGLSGVTGAGEVGIVAQSAACEALSVGGRVVTLPDPTAVGKPKSVSSSAAVAGSPVLENGPLAGVEEQANIPEPGAQPAVLDAAAAVEPPCSLPLSDDANHGKQVSQSPRASVSDDVPLSLSDSLVGLLDSSAGEMFFTPSQPGGTSLQAGGLGDNVSQSTSKPHWPEVPEGPVNVEGAENAAGSAVDLDNLVEAGSGSEASGGGSGVLELSGWPGSGDLAGAEGPEDDVACGSSPERSGSVHSAGEVSDDCLHLGSDDDGQWVLLDEAEDESVELFESSEEAAGSSPAGNAERGSKSSDEGVGPGNDAGVIETRIEGTGSASDVADVGEASSARDVGCEDLGKGSRESSGEAALDEDFADDVFPVEGTELSCEHSTGTENAALAETGFATSTKVLQVEVTRLDDVDAHSELGLLFVKAKQAMMQRNGPSGEPSGQQDSCRKLKEDEGFVSDIERASAETTLRRQKKPRKDLSLSSRQKTCGKAKQTDEDCGDVKCASKREKGPGQQGTQDEPKEEAVVVVEVVGERASGEANLELQKVQPNSPPMSGKRATRDELEAAVPVVEAGVCASVERASKWEERHRPPLFRQQSTCDDTEEAASIVEDGECALVEGTLEHQEEPPKDPLVTSPQESRASVEEAVWVNSSEESALADAVAFSCQKVSHGDTPVSGDSPCHPSMPCAQAEEAAWVRGDGECAPAEMAYPPDEPAAETAKVPGLFEQSSLDLSELPDALERLLGTVPLPELDADCFSLGAEPVHWLAAAERSKPVGAKEELLEEDSVLRDLAQGCSLTNEGLVALVPAQPPPPRCGLLPRDDPVLRKRSARRGFAFWQKAKLEAFASASCFEVDFEHNPELRIAFCRDRTVVLTPARCPPSGAWLAHQPHPDENGGSPDKLTPGDASLLDPSTPPATPPAVLPVTPPTEARDVSLDTPLDTPSKHEASSSQLDGPTARFALSGARLPADAVEERGRTLTLLSVEVHVRTRGDLRPDPAQDPVQCVLWYARGPRVAAPQAGALYWVRSCGDPRLADGELPRTGVTSLHSKAVRSERDLLAALVELVARWDPDLLLGYDVERGSWGYLCERAQHLDVDLHAQLSRAPPPRGRTEDIVGRILLGVWRILRKEIVLNVYTFENTYYHVKHHRVPLYSFRTLTDWFGQDLFRWRTVEHFALRARGNVELLDELDVLGKTSEMARIYGIQFLEVLSRGSQFRVESMLLRLARARRLVALSPSSAQRARQRAPEFVPLILEPRAQLYTDPVVVLDFQSLYPSVIIAHNYCFSTCLGRVDSLGVGGVFPFGCSTLEVRLPFLKTLRGHITVSPAGVAFVRPSIRRGLLPQMLNEVLGTRLMVKGAMSRCTDKALRRVLEAQQLGLKLLANVTYGYTAAGFSGRMPCVEVADSVVSKGREALERAIRTVETSVPGARVIYGDTDSLFVLLEGRTRQEAFQLGQEIADRVTADNPRPMRLRMEKVYQPCVLQTKKRYVGFAYEHPDQEEPKYDAKGIETVRRDTCPAVAKLLEKMLRVLFASRDVGAVKRFVKLQFSKILAERVSPQDFVFAREFRGLSGYQPGACVPALEIAQRLVRRDPRAEPLVGERVPYLVVYGHPGQRLIELVRQPGELLARQSAWRLNAHYYVQRVIGPALNRVLRLLGADCLHWYEELPRPRFVTPTTHPGRLSSYLVVGQLCLACGGQAEARQLCASCEADPSYTALVLGSKVQRVQKSLLELQTVCRSCMGFQAAGGQPPPCVSIDCPVLFKLARVTAEAQQAIGWHNSSSSGSARVNLHS